MLIGWRPSLIGWRPWLLVGWRPSPLGSAPLRLFARHPGGTEVLRQATGGDATEAFGSHSAYARAWADRYVIGVLVEVSSFLLLVVKRSEAKSDGFQPRSVLAPSSDARSP